MHQAYSLYSPLTFGRHITIQVPQSQDADQDMLNLNVGPAMTIGDLKAAVEFDTNIEASRQVLFHNGDPLSDNSQTLEALRINDGDIIVMQVRRVQAPGAARARPRPQARRVRDDAEILRLQALGEPRVLDQLRRHTPELANAVQDPQLFREIRDQMIKTQQEAEEEKERTIARLNADPFDMEAQKKIEEIIREAAVMQNITDTMENTPEGKPGALSISHIWFPFIMLTLPTTAFGRVHMLYIPVQVNGVDVKAFVDSGAQATIISPSCAERCGIMRLLDRRFAGIARGVGTAKISGRIHSAMIKIGSSYLACSFTVMEGKDVDLLLGLDMLKRHQACIDLKKGALVIEGEEVQFLGEADIPRNDMSYEEPTVEGPGGMQVGGRSGAIMAPAAEQPSSSQPQPGSSFRGQGQTVGESSRQAPLQPPSSGQFPPEAVTQLMELGFSREEVLRALQRAGGNLDIAAGILYQ